MAPILRSMTNSALMVPSPPLTVTSTNAPSDLFSRLPAEVRHMIYSYLGFPVGGYIWIDCPGHPTCTRTSHFASRVFFSKWTVRRHAKEGVFQLRRKIKKLQFAYHYRTLQGMHAHLTSVNDDDDENEYMNIWNRDNAWYLKERNPLSVNKEIRNELMDLMFGCTEVEFDGTLTAEYVFQGPHETSGHVRPPAQVFCLRLLSSTLTHMTSISISCVLHTSSVEDVCRSFVFIAKHATKLRCLASFIGPLYYVPTASILLLAQALKAVTTIAKYLQTLRFVVEERNLTIGQDWKPEDRVIVLDIPETSDIALGVSEVLDRLKKKEEAEHERYMAKLRNGVEGGRVSNRWMI